MAVCQRHRPGLTVARPADCCSLGKPLLGESEAGGQEQDSDDDVENGQPTTSKANGPALDHNDSLNAVRLESDHDFPIATGLWRFLDSPGLATACCIFLCFILKTVQQVRSCGHCMHAGCQLKVGFLSVYVGAHMHSCRSEGVCPCASVPWAYLLEPLTCHPQAPVDRLQQNHPIKHLVC